MNRSSIFRISVLVLSLLVGSATSGRCAAAKNRIRLAVGSKPGNIVYLQVDLARALGYFTGEGLDVNFKYFEGGTAAAEALASGAFEFSANSIDHAIKLHSRGRALIMIASFTDLPCVTMVVRRDLRQQIRSIRDLKGRRIGVTALGAGTHVLAANVLHKAGYSLRDVKIVPVGSGDSLIAAMTGKRIDVGMATDPTTMRLLLNGKGSILLDMTTPEETALVFNGPYQFTGLLTRPDVIHDHPALVQSMVRAIVRTNEFIRTHSAAEIAEKLPASIVGDRYIYVKSMEHSRPCFSKDGGVIPAAVANNIQSQIVFGAIPQNAAPAPELFMDARFVRTALGR